MASDTVTVGAVVQATEAEVNPVTEVMVPLLANLEDRTRTSPALREKVWRNVERCGEGLIYLGEHLDRLVEMDDIFSEIIFTSVACLFLILLVLVSVCHCLILCNYVCILYITCLALSHCTIRHCPYL